MATILMCPEAGCGHDLTHASFYEVVTHANDVHGEFFHKKSDYAESSETKTDHSEDIRVLRDVAKQGSHDRQYKLQLLVCSDLLEMHDRQSLSLDNWKAARALVQGQIGHSIQENHV